MSDLCMSTDFRFAWMGQPSAGPSAPWPCAPDGRMRRPAPRNVGVTHRLWMATWENPWENPWEKRYFPIFSWDIHDRYPRDF